MCYGVNVGPEACAALAPSLRGFGLKHSHFWQVCFFVHVFSIKLQIETPGGLEHSNCMRQPMLQIQIRCRIATQTYENFFKETT